jgi:beta-phosphoglucomutase
MIPKAVIFDLDGVIVSTDEYHFRAWKKLPIKKSFRLIEKQMNRFAVLDGWKALN